MEVSEDELKVRFMYDEETESVSFLSGKEAEV